MRNGHIPGEGATSEVRSDTPLTTFMRHASRVVAERKGGLGERASAFSTALGTRVQVRLRPLTETLARVWVRVWPELKYYLGFLTTALVFVAWVTNLIGKPLATTFGGGLTILGLAVAVLHYRYQSVRYPVVFLDAPRRIPGVRLVVLTADKRQSKAAIEAAMSDAKAHPPTFLYLAAASHLPPPRIFEIRDRFGLDEDAQAILSRAKRRCTEERIQGRYLYAVGGARQVFDIAAVVRPDEVVAEAETAKRITNTHAGVSDGGLALSPDYVRYHSVDGVRVAHYVLHKLYQGEPGTSSV